MTAAVSGPAASGPAASGLATFNTADAGEVRVRLLALTASPAWAEELLADRPYAGLGRLLARSDEILLAVDEDQIDAALAGHPRIGERARVEHFDDESAARSAREQAGVNSADADQKRELSAVNAAYEQRFGRIYLVAAAGLSASELVAKAKARLGNEPAAELDVVRAELAKITRSRLTDWLTP
jgi:2-oxo-4-hydroxy-4-carboxy-5-ureidoimidazoline decarboxylase